MTLLELVKLIEKIASRQPNIRTIVENDIYRLNAIPDVKYGVFAFTQGSHNGEVDGDFITFNLTLFYADRLLDDESNQLEIQSVGVETLSNILQTLSERLLQVSDYSFTPFNQRFSDLCAGVFTTIGVQVPITTRCADIFKENEQIKII